MLCYCLQIIHDQERTFFNTPSVSRGFIPHAFMTLTLAVWFFMTTYYAKELERWCRLACALNCQYVRNSPYGAQPGLGTFFIAAKSEALLRTYATERASAVPSLTINIFICSSSRFFRQHHVYLYCISPDLSSTAVSSRRAYYVVLSHILVTSCPTTTGILT